MKIYNSMKREREELKTLEPDSVSIYACGPTVYNLMHVGNARQICVFDVLRRYLKYRGLNVRYAQNFTDVDDKIINKANQEGTDFTAVSERYIDEYFKDARGLNVMDADIYPKATETIDAIIGIVQGLVEKGAAYPTENGDVYFSTSSFADYGKLSRQPLEDLKAGARIASGEEKRDPMDFAVWKSAKPGEPSWPSPWGNGRPGWHIECSAMVRKHFGDTIDIHGGGQDLIFPHHENEIAQSESFSGKELARLWMHNGFVNIDNKKMSKSEGNFFTVRDVADKYGYEPIRYLLISSHYRSPMNYSEEGIRAAKASLERLYNCRENLEFIKENASVQEMSPQESEILKSLGSHKERFIEVMDDDLNTADGLSCIFDMVREINTRINVQTKPSAELAAKASDLFTELCNVLGILYNEKKADINDEIEALIQKRNDARKNKDWAAADQIRDQLLAQNITLEDTPEGVKWKRM